MVQVGRKPVLRIPDRSVHGHQLVIITLEEWIEFVIVAAGALDRDAEQRREAGLHRLLLGVEVLIYLIYGLVIGDVGGGPHEAGRGQRLDLVGRRDGQMLVVDHLVAR